MEPFDYYEREFTCDTASQKIIQATSNLEINASESRSHQYTQRKNTIDITNSSISKAKRRAAASGTTAADYSYGNVN